MILTIMALAGAQCPLDAPTVKVVGRDCARAWTDANLRMNDMVAVGTHNSYKQAIPPAEMARLLAANPSATEIDYAHRPLTDQLDAGMRQLELDVYRDDAGGLYAAPDRDPALRAPGLKAMHMPGVDWRSSCVAFVACLRQIRGWSDAHRGHVPILILINAKDDATPLAPSPSRFDAAAFDALDAEIATIFPRDRLIVPDGVQGAARTLREGVLTAGWPTLGKVRGRVIFALDEGPAKVALYRGARRSLEGRTMFVNTEETSPAAAYLTLNDPIGQGSRIAAAVKAGFLVRTRADDGTHEARANDPHRRDAALASGAQYVSTDYPWPDPRFTGDYRVRLPDGDVAQCNTARAAAQCDLQIGRQGQGLEAPFGYLSPAERPDLTLILPGPALPGSALAIADRLMFEQGRSHVGSARWVQAQADVSSDLPVLFREAIGFDIDLAHAPVFARLLVRFGADRSAAVDAAKRYWQSPRPFIGNTAPICEPRTAALAASGDYPSGHTANGQSFALILAELLPKRATEILARARDYGDSRQICGAHTLGAVEGGRLAAAAIIAAEHGSAQFREDLRIAAEELNRQSVHNASATVRLTGSEPISASRHRVPKRRHPGKNDSALPSGEGSDHYGASRKPGRRANHSSSSR